MCLTVFYILWASIEQRYKSEHENSERKQHNGFFEKNSSTHHRRSSILATSPFNHHHNTHGSHLMNNRRDVHQFTIGIIFIFSLNISIEINSFKIK
jgi:hypothetical protein